MNGGGFGAVKDVDDNPKAQRSKVLVKESIAPKKIAHLEFGLLSPAEMQRVAEFQVCSRELFSMPSRTPAMGGCLDPRLGVSDKTSTCATCKRKLVDCAGHYGYIRLALPEITSENKQLKKLMKEKEKQYRLHLVTEMNITGKNQKYFWKLLDKLDCSHSKDMFKDCISGNRWTQHFKSVLKDEGREIDYPEDSLEQGPLDYTISMEEMDDASYVLRPDKSVATIAYQMK